MPRRRRSLFAAVVTVVTLAITASAAHAGALTLSVATRAGTPVLLLTGSASADAVDVAGGGNERLIFTPAVGSTIALAPGDVNVAGRCTASPPVWSCSLTGLGQWTPTSVTSEQFAAALGAGDDRLTMGTGVGETDVRGVVAYGEDGNDELIGRDELDWFVGGPGHDNLRPYRGSDVAIGGDGNDVLMLRTHEGSNGFSSPADHDDPSTSCGAGIDMVIRDEQDVDALTDLASCELDVDDAELSTVDVDPDLGRGSYEPGQTLGVSWKAKRSLPNVIENVWKSCEDSRTGTGSVTVITQNCTELARGDRFAITAGHVGKAIAVTSRGAFTIPDNPAGTWPAGERTTLAVRVMEASGPPPSVPVVTGPTRQQVLDRVLTKLVPATKPTATLRLAKKGIPLAGDATPHAVRIVGALSVPRAALGKRGKKPVVVAKVDATVSGAFSSALKLTADGRQLRSRLGKRGIVRGSLRMWVQAGDNGPAGARTVAVKVRAK